MRACQKCPAMRPAQERISCPSLEVSIEGLGPQAGGSKSWVRQDSIIVNFLGSKREGKRLS
jgi:hypothetical protein